jgi:hypothetical protein
MSETEDRIVPPRKTMIINGKIRGAGYKYKVKKVIQKIEPPKEAKDANL